uniref:Uncharacterized protein n=1 Tax=Mus musculus TaxID=10090 RepID=Q3V2W7_MOUSE|nr:unnamed protein product [Mus musculus]BAE43388.1 unnamed protein product [Mus musculus]
MTSQLKPLCPGKKVPKAHQFATVFFFFFNCRAFMRHFTSKPHTEYYLSDGITSCCVA